jgi:putative FmdB family regulatory protein
MPVYEYYCPGCQREFTLTLSLQEAEQGATCPSCGGRGLEPRLSSFFAKTSRKS